MFRQPKPFVTPDFRVLRKIERIAQSDGGSSPLGNRREIEYRKRDHYDWMLCSKAPLRKWILVGDLREACRKPIQKSDLSPHDTLTRVFQSKPIGSINLRKFLLTARLRRPFHRECVTSYGSNSLFAASSGISPSGYSPFGIDHAPSSYFLQKYLYLSVVPPEHQQPCTQFPHITFPVRSCTPRRKHPPRSYIYAQVDIYVVRDVWLLNFHIDVTACKAVA